MINKNKMTELVSIGVPVRNGGHLLDGIIHQLLNQTYSNIEIVISDNNSSDITGEIAKKYAEEDSRVKYFCQNVTLTASENFRFVVENATGKFFMWASHDDRFDFNYVEELIKPFFENPNAVLTFSKYAIFQSHSDWSDSIQHSHQFEHSLKNSSLLNRIYQNVYILNYHVYGLFLRKKIVEYSWPSLDHGADQAFLFYMAEQGDFLRANSTCFYYYKPQISKSKEQRAIDNALKKLKPFPLIRLSYTTAIVAKPLKQKITNFLYKSILFALVFVFRATKNTRVRYLFSWLGKKF